MRVQWIGAEIIVCPPNDAGDKYSKDDFGLVLIVCLNSVHIVVSFIRQGGEIKVEKNLNGISEYVDGDKLPSLVAS
jgi:hypothetical protein